MSNRPVRFSADFNEVNGLETTWRLRRAAFDVLVTAFVFRCRFSRFCQVTRQRTKERNQRRSRVSTILSIGVETTGNDESVAAFLPHCLVEVVTE